ncbi:MAG: phosphatase PAP2 family protein [Lachnospiraceae bacterium]|nr:phosphatase PAP2 family protein [Lachnospiraceae bacterium]
MLIELLQRHANEFTIMIMSFFTWCGEEAFMILVLGFLYWCWDKELGKKAGTSIVVALTLGPLIKNIALRRRPYFDHPDIQCLRPVKKEADLYDIAAQGFSFPSMHSANSVTVFGTLAYRGKKKPLLLIALVMPFLIGLSRIYLGVHYPTDVCAGWLLGAIVVFLVPFLEEKIPKRWVMHLILFIAVLPGVFYCKTNDYFTCIGIMAGFFLALPFEERFVHFEETKRIPCIILRLLGGGLVYVAVNTLLKLPFPKELLESTSSAAFLIRSLRYAIDIFIAIGIYPLVFRYEKLIFKKEEA